MPPKKQRDPNLVLDYSAIDREAIDGWLDGLYQTKGFLDWVKQRDFALLKHLGSFLPPEQYHLYIGRRAELLELGVEAQQRFKRQQEEKQKKRKKNVIVLPDAKGQESGLTMA